MSATGQPPEAKNSLRGGLDQAKESPPARPDEPALPPSAGTTVLRLLGVDYHHLKTSDGGDLYLTEYGASFWEHLLPENWYARDWFESHRQRLVGTSTSYRIPTRKIRGTSVQLVAKWSRVGEEIPIDTLTITKFIQAEFNSPFEEFALLTELRRGDYGPPGIDIRTQKPLAIYVPSKRVQLWQTGRSESKIAAKLARHPSVELDILRQYVVLYGWIKGVDIVEAAQTMHAEAAARETLMAQVTCLVAHELAQKGYRVIDMKPAHIIVRPQPDGALLRDRHGQIAYALIDYELLERTPEHEQAVRSVNRQYYLRHMARRFEIASGNPLPSHLRRTNLLGVDYVFGHAESTGGLLWVIGQDPDLFNYFVPERWRRTPRKELTPNNQVFHTCTKDNINLVWRVSRLGDDPRAVLPADCPVGVDASGFNSPFEEFACALELSRAGVKTVYPRAIYMTGHRTKKTHKVADPRRYKELEHLRTPDGQPALRREHDYITIWGFWNGPDELLASDDGQHYGCMNLKQAAVSGKLSGDWVPQLIESSRRELARCGFEPLHLRPEHLLLSFAPDGALVRDAGGIPEVRLCNFELVRRIKDAAE